MTNSTRLPAPRSMAQHNNSAFNSDPIPLLFALHDAHARLASLETDHAFYTIAVQETEDLYTQAAQNFDCYGGSEEKLAELANEMVEYWERLNELTNETALCKKEIFLLNEYYKMSCAPYRSREVANA